MPGRERARPAVEPALPIPGLEPLGSLLPGTEYGNAAAASQIDEHDADFGGSAFDDPAAQQQAVNPWFNGPWQSPSDVAALDLQATIAACTWETSLRPALYAAHSAAGLDRITSRRAGLAPDLTGTGSVTSTNRFVEAVRSGKSEPDGDLRMQMLLDAMNTELVAAGVPRLLNPAPVYASQKGRGTFTASSFTVVFQDGLQRGAPNDDGVAAELATVGLHESRHAEQTWLEARSYAAEGSSAAEVATKAGTPAAIAQLAVDDQAERHANGNDWDSPEQEQLATMSRNHGNGEIAAMEKALGALNDRLGEGRAALAFMQANPYDFMGVFEAEKASFEIRSAAMDVAVAYDAYRRMPREADAHEVGDGAEVAYWSGTL